MTRRRFCVLSLGLAAFFGTQATSFAADVPYTWIFVSDMHCGHCAKKIAAKLETLSGVEKVQISLKDDVAMLTPARGANLSPRVVWEAVEQIKFTPVKLHGPSGVYKSKPAQ